MKLSRILQKDQNETSHEEIFLTLGIVPLEIYLQNNDKRFYDLGIRMADEQFKVLDDTEYAKLTLDKKNWYSMGLSWNTRFWIDDMYMITMIQTQAYRATKDPRYMNRVAKEMIDYLDKLQTSNGLFHHAPDVPIYWGRGNGWMAAGMAELLRDMPETNIYKKSIMTGYKKMLVDALKNSTEPVVVKTSKIKGGWDVRVDN